MQKIRMGFVVLTSFLVLIFLMQHMAVSAYAQSPKPSAPKFTIQFPNDDTIQIVIQNQAFTSSSSVNLIMYYYRVKDHYGQQWIEARSEGQLQSNSTATLITIPPLAGSVPKGSPFDPFMNNFLNNSTVLDFQIQAKTGYYLVTQKPGYMPGIPPVGPGDGYSEITFNDSETSAWSNTVTVDLKDKIMLSPSPTLPNFGPTSSPTVPEFSWLMIPPLFIFVLSIAVIVSARKTCRAT
jgi:hypothetical protein